MIPLPKILTTVSPLLNGEFEVISMTRGQEKADQIRSKAGYIAVLPFERGTDGKLKSIYCVKSENPATSQTDVTLVIDKIDSTKDTTSYDTVCRAMIEETGIDLEKLGIDSGDIFYLGAITTAIPVNSRFLCYAIDLTKADNPKKPIEFARTLSKSNFTKDSSEIVKLGFHQVVNGDYSDATVLSGAFLLVSYFN